MSDTAVPTAGPLAPTRDAVRIDLSKTVPPPRTTAADARSEHAPKEARAAPASDAPKPGVSACSPVDPPAPPSQADDNDDNPVPSPAAPLKRRPTPDPHRTKKARIAPRAESEEPTLPASSEPGEEGEEADVIVLDLKKGARSLAQTDDP